MMIFMGRLKIKSGYGKKELGKRQSIRHLWEYLPNKGRGGGFWSRVQLSHPVSLLRLRAEGGKTGLVWSSGEEAIVKKLRKAHGLSLINKAKSYTGGGRKAPSPTGHYDLLKRKLVKKHQKKQTQVG